MTGASIRTASRDLSQLVELERLVRDGGDGQRRRLRLGVTACVPTRFRLPAGRRRGERVADEIPKPGQLFVVVIQNGQAPEPAGGKVIATLRAVEPVDVLENLWRQASRLMSWLIRARLTPCLRASSAAFFTSPASSIRRHSRARRRASMIRGRVARSLRPRGPQAWPAASGDGTQAETAVFSVVSAWHATFSVSGPVERGPSSGGKSEGRRWFWKRRGPPARC